MFPTSLSDATSELSSAAVSALLGEFTAAFKQADRLLRLHTPLGPNVLLAESLKGIECISGAGPASGQWQGSQLAITGYMLQIDALSLDAHLELKALIGQPVLLELQTDQSKSVLRPLHGYVTQAQCIGANGGMARYRLAVQPWLAFLGHGRDSAVFQDQTVLQIVQSIFTDYQNTLQGSGKLQPAWRLDIADASVYPKRSLTTQYQESDLQFVERLLLEEGLFYWFEHSGDASNASLGQHTLVLADHNGAFKPNARSQIRFSQSKGTIEDDAIDQWRPQRQWHTHAIELASWDYRTLGVRSVTEHAEQGGEDTSAYVPSNTPALVRQDTPGAYAYENLSQGQRLAKNQHQAASVAGHSTTACGSVRALAPGSTFTLSGHASASPSPQAILHLIHHARNNLSAQLQAYSGLIGKSPTSPIENCASSYINHSELQGKAQGKAQDIFYRNAALVLPLAVPYRAASTDGHGQRIHPKPSVTGSQTALVIGVPGQQLSTDRDHRIKVQFAWQRGASSQSRLPHPAQDGHSGAPAQDAASATTGTWVRVATPLAPIAGANWGSVALPRIGQEVLVSFLGGDIDRPVIVGSLYNGQGADNQQSNQVAQGAANATGNAPSWFPGSQEASGKQGKLPGHQHNAVLSGIKTQALSTSHTGQGGYNQIVFDDTPGQSRLALHNHATGQGGNHSGASELNLGHLRQQTDNQRLGSVGYGFELKTHHSGAVRSGSGMLITADKRGGNDSGAASHQMDSKEAQSQLQSGQDLLKSLSETAQQHKAMLPVLQATEVKPDKLSTISQLEHNAKVMQAKASGTAAGAGEGSESQGGGAGQASAYNEPLLVLSAPAGITMVTPQSASFNAGSTTSVAAGQDINLLAQANLSYSVKGGISLFTYGKASNPKKPNQEVGIQLHAASGKVSSQSQSDKTQITADKGIQVNSTTDAVTIQAPQHVLLTAQGAYIKMSGGNIEVHAPGLVDFKASMKSWTGPKSDSNSLKLTKPKGMFDEQFVIKDELSGELLAYKPYRIENSKGEAIAAGITDAQGRTQRVHTMKPEELKLFF